MGAYQQEVAERDQGQAIETRHSPFFRTTIGVPSKAGQQHIEQREEGHQAKQPRQCFPAARTAIIREQSARTMVSLDGGRNLKAHESKTHIKLN